MRNRIAVLFWIVNPFRHAAFKQYPRQGVAEMRHTKKIVLSGIAALMTMGVAYAQEEPPGDRQAMTPEQRQAAMEQRRTRQEARRNDWENMSDEQRATARAERDQKMEQRRAANRERYENMSDEERTAMRERRTERQSRHSGNRHQGQRGGHSKGKGRNGG